ncbi:hypothetical protein N790_03565, partial [Arenimonas malthae CC-JY-1]
MGWILGILGALFGAVLADDSRMLFGFFAGALLGVLLAQALKLRSRVAQLEQQVAALRVAGIRAMAPETPAPRPLAEAAPASTRAEPAATTSPSPAAAAAP